MHDHLPIPDALQQTQGLSKLELLNWVLYGGEDFELVLCLPHAIAQPLVEQLDEDAAIVGQITSDQSVYLEDAQGQTDWPAAKFKSRLSTFWIAPSSNISSLHRRRLRMTSDKN
jgi:thiamine monophosphate kinase